MPYVVVDGVAKYVPGVYNRFQVVSSLPGPAPDFMIPVLLGGAPSGHPYNADASKQVQESRYTPFSLQYTADGVKSYFGEDSDVGIAMTSAKKKALPFAYVANLAALTRASVIVTSTGPVNQYTLLPRKWGAPSNHIKIKAASGTSLEFTPLKHFSMATTNIGTTDTRIYVKDNSWVRVGQVITIGDNATTNVTKTVLTTGFEFTSAGQKRPYVDLTAAVGSAFTTANYALILEYDANTESSGTLADAQAQIDWVNQFSKLFIAVKHAAFTNPAAIVALASATVLKDISAWSTVTKGTSPAPTASDYTAFVALMEASAWDQFIQDTGTKPQSFYIADSSSTIHGTMRDWATDKRAEGNNISMTTGCAWGDTVVSAGNDTDPGFRGAALNSQDFMICAPGLDKIAAYLSLGPQVWASRVRGGVGHNLTSDSIVYTEVEKVWDERVSGHLTLLHKKGVCTIRLSEATKRYVISEGLSTLQQNASAWNTVTNDTCLVMQRDLADFNARVMTDGLDGSQLGADAVSPETVAAVAVTRGQFLEKIGTLQKGTFRIVSITLNESGAGYDVVWAGKPPVSNDFMVVTCQILVGE